MGRTEVVEEPAKSLAARIREKVANVKDLAEEPLHVELWGVDVIVRALTGKERSQVIQASLRAGSKFPDLQKLWPLLVIKSTRDPERGALVFDASDAEMLNDKAARRSSRLPRSRAGSLVWMRMG
jgi:hypothetical protein